MTGTRIQPAFIDRRPIDCREYERHRTEDARLGSRALLAAYHRYFERNLSQPRPEGVRFSEGVGG